jgi:hypothetical protein
MDQTTKTSQESKLNLQNLSQRVSAFFNEKSKKVSVDTLNWIAVLFFHGATIPNLLALMAGITDNAPPLDITLLIWCGLMVIFVKAAIQKEMLIMLTMGFGFVLQAVLMMLIFFK